MREYSMNTNMYVAHYTLRLVRRSFMRIKTRSDSRHLADKPTSSAK